MLKKAITVFIAGMLLFGVAACGFTENEEPIDPTKTYLYIGNYDGGIGHAWLEEVAALFTEEYKNTSFEQGKTGVKVVIENKKNEFVDSTLMGLMPSSINDVFFTGSVTYNNFVNAGVIADITDIVTAKDELVGDTKVSIEDKMFDELTGYFKKNNKYYAIPGFDCVYGIAYDADLFEDEGLLDSGNGPDNIKGTYDDGLPATWEDFKKLMVKMTQKGLVPFTWSGEFQTYRQRFMTSLWASYEGANDYMLNYNFSGTDSQFGEITKSNGYKLQGQNGKKAALMAGEYIIGNSAFYSDQAMKTTQKHTIAQEEFVASIRDPKGKRIAMILEGAWWENEAKPVFDLMERYGAKYGYGKRNFAMMPLPKFIGSEGIPDQEETTGNVLCGTGGDNIVCINAATQKLELAKRFVKFSTSNEALAIFTRSTSTPRPYEYDMPATELAKMTSFGKSVWNMYSDGHTKVIYPLHTTAMVNDNSLFFSNWQWGATVNSKVMTEPMMAYYTYNTGSTKVTADKYFEGLKTTYSESKWQELKNWF